MHPTKLCPIYVRLHINMLIFLVLLEVNGAVRLDLLRIVEELSNFSLRAPEPKNS
jgi:hypothetical protein